MSEGVITAWRTTSERAKPGFIRLAVLDILKRKNLHAYGSIKAIRDETMGLWAPSPGSIYPTLRNLTEQGLVKDLGDHTYQITEAGLNELDVKEEEVYDGWQEFIDPSDKHIAIGSVKSLVNLIEKEIEIIVSSGSEGQINEAEVFLRYIELSFRTLMQATSLKKRNLDWDFLARRETSAGHGQKTDTATFDELPF